MTVYATPSDLATYMRKAVDTANAEMMLAGASSLIQQYLGWDVASGTVTERVDTAGGSTLFLRTLRLNSVTSITDASGNTTVASGYTWSEKGMLHMGPELWGWFRSCWDNGWSWLYWGSDPTWGGSGVSQTRWHSGFGAYTVVYDSGYPVVPPDIVLAACSMVARALTVPPGTQQEISTAGGRTESARYFDIAGFGIADTEKYILARYALPQRLN